jgi:hypothetical protein
MWSVEWWLRYRFHRTEPEPRAHVSSSLIPERPALRNFRKDKKMDYKIPKGELYTCTHKQRYPIMSFYHVQREPARSF